MAQFTKNEVEILRHAAKEIEEVFDDIRKGVPQTRYVMHVDPTSTYFSDNGEDPTPPSLWGYWMMDCADDLRHRPLGECLGAYGWGRCVPVEKTVTVWEAA